MDIYDKTVLEHKKNAPNKIAFSKTITFVFFAYWLTLVAWQNLRGSQNRGTADLLVKCSLLLFLLYSFTKRSLKIDRNVLRTFIVFTCCMLFTMLRTETLSGFILINYGFLILYILLTYGIGRDYEITKDDLIRFFYCIIAVVAYTILYAIVADRGQYARALGASVGYGSEFRSFFISNNEFAIYCFYAMAAAMILVDMDSRLSWPGRTGLLIMATVFLVHIILSFSRVTVICTAAFLVIYAIFYKKSRAKTWIYIVLLGALAAIALSGEVQRFAYEVVFKSGNVSSRESMVNLSLDYFSQGTLVERLFGRGITQSDDFSIKVLSNSHVHNGYVQVLLWYGIIGLVWMIGFLISQIIDGLMVMKQSKLVGTVSIAFALIAAANMVTSTQLLFASSIDSFFLTTMYIIVPKYMRNAVRKGVF